MKGEGRHQGGSAGWGAAMRCPAAAYAGYPMNRSVPTAKTAGGLMTPLLVGEWQPLQMLRKSRESPEKIEVSMLRQKERNKEAEETF